MSQNSKRKVGRPPKEIEEKLFKNLCLIQCTQEEIANVLEVDHKTLNKWCKKTFNEDLSQAYKRLSAGGKMSLRRAMFDKAVNNGGNVAMMIWLSKQYLGMSEKIVDESTDFAYSVPEFLTPDKAS